MVIHRTVELIHIVIPHISHQDTLSDLLVVFPSRWHGKISDTGLLHSSTLQESTNK